MSMERLPVELLITILAHYTPNGITLKQYLALRLVNRQFENVVVYALFDVGIGTRHFLPGFNRFARDEAFVFRYWRAYLRNTKSYLSLQECHSGEDSRGARRQILDADHKIKVRATLLSVVEQIAPSLDDVAPCYTRTGMPLIEDYIRLLSEYEQCIYVLCKSAICVHGSYHAWNLLTLSIEQSILQSVPRPDSIYTSSHDVVTWNIYAAAYLNNINRIKVLLEPMRVDLANHTDPDRRKLTYDNLVRPPVKRSNGHWYGLPAATFDEQRWVNSVSSALVIAASLGHLDLVSYLLRLEPNLRYLAFRTHLYRTSKFDAIKAAICNDQREVFKMLVDSQWPLATDKEHAHIEYLPALETAVKTLRLDDRSDNILSTLLNMSDIWHAPYFFDRMIQAAAQKNDVRLAKVVIEHLNDRHSTYYLSEPFRPRLWTQISRPRAFAMGTASYFGHIELVELLLRNKYSTHESGLEAIECAIHSLTCHVKDTNENHITILKILLPHAGELLLEIALVKAACKQTTKFMTAFAININLKQKVYCNWHIWLDRRCRSSKEFKSASIMDPDDKASIGEAALAAALSFRQFETACMLIEEFSIVLKHYFVRIKFPVGQYPDADWEDVTKHLIDNGMTVEQSVDIGIGHDGSREGIDIAILPQAHPAIKPVQFLVEWSLYCML